jgi:hypothetical protein
MRADIGPPITRTGAADAARHELSKGIYHHDDTPWPVRVFTWFGQWIDRLYGDVANHAPGGGIGALLILLILGALVGFARWQLGPLGRTPAATGPVLEERRATAADLYTEARRAAAGQLWADAVVAGMRALVRDLEERSLIDERPGRTAHELARDVAAIDPAAVPAVRDAAEIFDAVRYGGRTATAASYAQITAADEAVPRRRRILAGQP